MFRWHCVVALVVVSLFPACAYCQTTGQGNQSNQGNAFSGNGMGGTQGGGSTQGSFGNPNTTLLGATVNLNFNQVFGTSPALANTNPDMFAAYRPSSTGTGTSTGSSRAGNSFSGSGMSGFSAAGSGINNSGFGSTGAGSRTQAGISGVAGGNQLGGGQFGGNAGGLGGNRNAVNVLGGAVGGNLGAGGLNRNMLGGGANFNRNTLGGMGGMNFLGGGTNFLGGGATGQSQPTTGFQIHIDAPPPPVAALNTAGTFNVEVQTRLQNAPGLAGAQNLQVATTGNIAVLKGKVTSETAKSLAGAMLLLEPGINLVDNQLEVVAIAPPQANPPQPNPPKQ